MMRKFVLLILALLPLSISAQTLSEMWMTSDTLHVYFPQNKAVLNPEFRNNGTALKEFTEEFHKMKDTPGSKVRSVLIVSGASPEGNVELNRRLSDSRAQAVLDYLLEQKLLDPSEVEVESRGIDWKGLYEIMEYSQLPYKDAVMKIIDGPEIEVIGGRNVEIRQKNLMMLEGGRVWKEIYEDYFPNLRGTMVMIVWDIKREKKVIPPPPAPEPEPEPEPQPEPEPEPEPQPEPEPAPVPAPEPVVPAWTFNMVVKTNLLYDGMLIPNLGVEFNLWKGLVLNVEYMHNGWMRFNYTHWYRVHGAEFGLKYYINKEHRPFAQGHHVGLSAQMLTFDLTGILVDAEPWKFGPMLTYGYALPITKRLNLDFEVGVGALFGNVYKYDAVDQKRLLRETEKMAFVPKLGVTLQYLIGKKNFNERRK